MTLKVLVTGAAGFIGSRLATYFQAQGARVFVDVQRDDAGATKRWPLAEQALWQATGGEVPDAILHAAGSGTVAKVAAQPTLELPANLGALLAVLQYVQARAPNARVVLLSSAALYGNAPPQPQREADARAPVSLYGLAKAQAEQLAAYYAAQLAVTSTAVRLFSVYGPGLRKQLLWDGMNKLVASRAGTCSSATFFGTGHELRDWVHIDDVCRFMWRLLETPARRSFDIYNCAGSPASTGDVLSRLAQAAGASPPGFSGQVRAGDPQCLVADCSKAESELGWRADVPWSAGVAGYAQWFADAHAGLAGGGG